MNVTLVKVVFRFKGVGTTRLDVKECIMFWTCKVILALQKYFYTSSLIICYVDRSLCLL